MLSELIALCLHFWCLLGLSLLLLRFGLFFLLALNLDVAWLFFALLLRLAALDAHFLEVQCVAFDVVFFEFEVLELL